MYIWMDIYMDINHVHIKHPLSKWLYMSVFWELQMNFAHLFDMVLNYSIFSSPCWLQHSQKPHGCGSSKAPGSCSVLIKVKLFLCTRWISPGKWKDGTEHHPYDHACSCILPNQYRLLFSWEKKDWIETLYWVKGFKCHHSKILEPIPFGTWCKNMH